MQDTRFAPPKAAVADVVDVKAVRADREPQWPRLRRAANACLAYAAVLFFQFGTRNHVGLITEALLLALAFGVYKGSRICAVVASLVFVLNFTGWVLVGEVDLFFLGFYLAIAVVLGLGLIAAFEFHRRPEDDA